MSSINKITKENTETNNHSLHKTDFFINSLKLEYLIVILLINTYNINNEIHINNETKERLDGFIEAMIEIAKEIKENPEEVLKHPLNTPVKKVDEVLAARKLDLAYKPE